jgi:hypothetical protein
MTTNPGQNPTHRLPDWRTTTADTAAAPPLAIGHEAPGITLDDLISPQRELVAGEGV